MNKIFCVLTVFFVPSLVAQEIQQIKPIGYKLQEQPVKSTQEPLNTGYVGEIEGYRWDAQSKSYFPATRTQQVRPAPVVQAPRYFQPGLQHPMATGTAEMARGSAGSSSEFAPQPNVLSGVVDVPSTMRQTPRSGSWVPQSLLTPAGGQASPFARTGRDAHAGSAGSGLAQRKADYMARTGTRGHVMQGQWAPGARFEGVGWSSVSAQSAIEACCYWGQRTPVEIGVARGRGLWFATVQYR